MWASLMHADHGWFARHQFTTAGIVVALAVFAPGALTWML